MSTEWFTKRAGDPVLSKEQEDGSTLSIIGDTVPDWVKVPPVVPGEEPGPRRVINYFNAPCPVTGVMCRHLQLDGGLYIAESDQMYWYRRD